MKFSEPKWSLIIHFSLNIFTQGNKYLENFKNLPQESYFSFNCRFENDYRLAIEANM